MSFNNINTKTPRPSGSHAHSSRPPLSELVNHAHNIKKEKQNIKIYDHFNINPARFELYTEKPNNKKEKGPMSLNDLEKNKENIQLEKELKDKISQKFMTPKEKFSFPMTANQELGWFADDRIKTKLHGKSKCPETKYASEFYAITKVSPFSNKKK